MRRASAKSAQRAAMRVAQRAAEKKARAPADEAELLEELRQDAEGVRLVGKTALAAEQKLRGDRREPEYWFAVAFESREQKLAALSALGLPVHADKYLSGTDFVRALELAVPLIQRKRHRLRENKSWAELCGD